MAAQYSCLNLGRLYGRPISGYNTWYDVTGAFDEALLLKTVDAFMALELPKYGYNYWVSAHHSRSFDPKHNGLTQ